MGNSLDQVVKPAERSSSKELAHEAVHSLYSDLPTLRTYSSTFADSDSTLPRVTLTDNYGYVGQTKLSSESESAPPPSEKTEDKKEETQPPPPQSDGTKQIWGGDADASKTRHKPMDVTINEDGTATVIVKPGDTAWDIARRTLEAQHPGEQITNKQIYDEVKKLEETNGKNLTVIHPGEGIKIPQDDVAAVKAATDKTKPKEEDYETTADDGTKVKVTHDKGGNICQVETTDANGQTHVYKKEGEEWTVDGRCDPSLTIEENDGTITISDDYSTTTIDKKSHQAKHHTNTQEECTERQRKRYEEEQRQEQARQEREKQEQAKQSKTYHDGTANADYTVSQRDENGAPTEMTVTKDGKSIHYKKNGSQWTSDESGQEQKVDMVVKQKDDGGLEIKQRTPAGNDFLITTTTLGADGTATTKNEMEVRRTGGGMD